MSWSTLLYPIRAFIMKKLITGYDYNYHIDEEWYFYNRKWEKITWSIAWWWYKQVTMRLNWKHVNRYIHRLVWEYFIDNPYNKKEINHKDGNKTNNHYLNLERATRSENELHKRTWRKQSEYSKLMSSKANSKKVYIYDKEWKLTHYYNSVRQASAATGIKVNTIIARIRSTNNKERSYKWLNAR